MLWCLHCKNPHSGPCKHYYIYYTIIYFLKKVLTLHPVRPKGVVCWMLTHFSSFLHPCAICSVRVQGQIKTSLQIGTATWCFRYSLDLITGGHTNSFIFHLLTQELNSPTYSPAEPVSKPFIFLGTATVLLNSVCAINSNVLDPFILGCPV